MIIKLQIFLKLLLSIKTVQKENLETFVNENWRDKNKAQPK